jgi:hypothetical protein
MELNKRTFLLGGILVAVLAFGMGRPIFMQPVRDAEQDLDSAKRNLDDASANDMQLALARKRLGDAMAASLPPSLNDAHRLYLEWITDLALECNFARSSILPGSTLPRSGKYVLVSVIVQAEASLEDLSRFLFEFKQADLMHRITKMDVSSNNTAGKPRMEFSFTAEGMSVMGSRDKTELAARVPLATPVGAESTQLTVGHAEGFPAKPPFITKVGSEAMRVTAIDDRSWTVVRAFDGSDADEHEESTLIRHFPVAWDRRDRRFEDYRSLLDLPPFTKPPVPRDYNPELAGLDDITIAPGETASITARVDDYNVDVGEVEFSLKDAAAGMEIDSVTGQIRWQTEDDQEPQAYQATVVAAQQNNPELKLQQTVTFTVKVPNQPPELTINDTAVALLGQGIELAVTATDDAGPENLTYALEAENLPEGLAIDGQTGVLTWNPPLTFAPGTHTVNVKVTDQGDPPASTTKSVTIEVKDDDARFTVLTASVRKDGRPEAWFENTRTNSQQKLHVGDLLQVANIAAEIVAIEARVVTFRDNDGTWQLALGNHTRHRVLKSPALQEETDEAVEKDASAE